MESQINSVSIVFSTVCSGEYSKYQSSASTTFMKGIHWWRVDSPHNRPVTRKMFPFDDVIMICDISHTTLSPYRITTHYGFTCRSHLYTGSYLSFTVSVDVLAAYMYQSVSRILLTEKMKLLLSYFPHFNWLIIIFLWSEWHRSQCPRYFVLLPVLKVKMVLLRPGPILPTWFNFN